jgi:hypothetical protein
VEDAALQMRLGADVLVVLGLVDDPGAGSDARLRVLPFSRLQVAS